MSSIKELREQPLAAGVVRWIGLSPERRGIILTPQSVRAEVGTGLVGDHHARSGKSKRQVTLIQAEHLPVIAGFLRRNELDPALLRRNLVVSGVNLLALKDRSFQIGNAQFRGSGPCAPCSRMEEMLGPGGYSAMRGHGGITAVVEIAGTIQIGDAVLPLDMEELDESSVSA